MKIIDGFTLRTVVGQSVVVAEGVKQVNFNKLISLNPSAALLWQNVEGKVFSYDDLADILVAHYDVDRDTAFTDAKEIADQWIKAGLCEM